MQMEQGPIHVGEHDSLWRYVPLHTFFLHLQGKVFLPTIASLQACDLREGAQVFDHIVATVGFTDAERKELRHWVRERRLSEIERKCFDLNRGHSGANQKVYFKHYYTVLQRSRFAWCWFKSEHESAAMWSHYGNKGVAIRTRLSLLQKALASHNGEWLISRMKYIDFGTLSWDTFLNSEDGKQWVRRPFLIKGVEYESEHEVRLILVKGEQSRGIQLDGIQPADWMDQVLFWPEMPTSCLEAVTASVTQLHPALRGRLGKSGLHSFGDCVDVPHDSDSSYNELLDQFSHEEIQHWPPFLQKP